MNSKTLRNWKKALALLSAFALLFVYLPMGSVSKAATVEVYHETFSSGVGAATQSGSANLSKVTGKTFTGNDDGAALYISNRSNDYDAADFSISTLGLQNGKTYTITVKGYVDSGVTVASGSQAFLQTVDSYGWLGAANFVAGQAFTLTGTYTVDTSKDRAIRVQSNSTGASVPFYVGDILITEDVTTPSAHTDPTNTVSNNNIPTILYHRVVDTASNQYTDTSVANFRSHIDYLQDNGYTTLSADEYVNILQGKATAPAKPILMTFDDATPDFVTTVLPYLEGKNMKCILFVVSDWIGKGYSMTQTQLQEIAASHPNVSIESHSKTHDQTTWSTSISYDTALAELTAAKTYINGITGKNPVLLAYPYGNSSVDARAAAYDTGIQYAFKVGTPNDGAYKMGRYYTLDVSVADFAASIGGPAPKTTVYHETFASGVGKATQAGGASLTQVTGKVFTGNDDGAALYVSNRKNNWDGVDFKFTDLGLTNGQKYTVTIKGYIDTGATIPSGGAIWLQTVNSYGWLAGANVEAGKAFTMSKEFTVDTSKDSALRINSSNEGASIPYYIGDILITTDATTPTPPASGAQVYHETFASGKGFAAQAGGASLSQVTGKTFEGNSDGNALYISNRNNNWDAADLSFSNLKLENGKTYAIKITGYVDTGATVASNSQVWIQTVNSYSLVGSANMEAGKAFTITGAFKVDTSKDANIRIQSNNEGAKVPFYIGDIIVANAAYHESFKDGKGAAGQSGTPVLTTAAGVYFDGNADGAALYVNNRANNWDGVDFTFSNVGMENGKAYTIKIAGYVASDAPGTTAASAVVLGTNTTYKQIVTATLTTGHAFTLAGDYTVTTSDTAIRVQSNEAGKAVPFYIGDVLVTEKGALVSNEGAPPAQTFTTITFEDQTAGGFVARGGVESVTVTSEANHTSGGNYSLKTTGRQQNWQGPSLNVAKYIDKGSKYRITVWAKVITPSSVTLDLSAQIGSSSPSYPNITKKLVSTSDGWVQLSGEYTFDNIPDNFASIYVQCSTVSAEYYIDDISFEKTGSAPTTIENDLTAIKDVYKGVFPIGTAILPTDLSGLRFDLLKKHFDIATAGNAMKPESLEKVKGVWTWTSADDMVQKVLDAGLKMHGHVLVWHSQSPAWLNTQVDGSGNALKDAGGKDLPLSRTEALANMREYITTVVNHFGNKVVSWDVVNEAMNDNPSTPSDWKASLRKSPWYNAIGSDYVEQAFLIAREVIDADPNLQGIKLYYNDYNEDNQNKATAIYNMVKEINDNYAKTHPGKKLIDGIGMQAHYSLSTNPVNVETSLDKFIELGVEVSITELDIQAGSNGTQTADQTKAQGYLYAQLFKIFKAHSANIGRVTIWGMDDGESWRKESSPLPFDSNLQHKPAYHGIVDPDKFMAENAPPALPDAKQGTAGYGTPVIDGTVDSVWSNAPAMQINQYLAALNGASGTVKAMWDDSNLYLLYQVSNSVLDKSSPNAWEQDSVEAFVDENNMKTSFYQDDDGQYRVNFANEKTFNPSSISAGFESAATTTAGANYTVEMKIPFKTITPADNVKIGFDAQVNDGEAGARISTATWNDAKGVGYQDTSVYGVLTLTGKETGTTPPVTTPGDQPTISTGTSQDGKSVNAMAEITPTAPDSNGEVKANVDANTLNNLAATAKDAEAKGQTAVVVIKVNTPAAASEVNIDLPKDALVKLAQDTKTSVKVDAGMASITFDAKAMDSLSGQLTGANVNLNVSKVDSASLPQDVKAKVGDRPVFDISLTSGNTAITNFGGGKLQIAFPYTLGFGENKNAIIVNYIGSDGKLNTVRGRYDEATGTVICVTTHLSKYAVSYNNVTFKDVSAGSWYKNAVAFIGSRGISDGIGGGKFGPDKNLTRAEFLVMLMRAYQIAPDANPSANFADAGNTYYTGYLAAAKRLGISEGVGGDRFAPNRIVTRQEMFTLLYNALKSINELPAAKAGKSFTSFSDSGKVANWANEAMKHLTEAGIITGDNGRLNPSGTAKRSDSAQTLYNLLNG